MRAGANLAARNKGGMTALALACVKVGNMEKLSWGRASADEAPPGLAVGPAASSGVSPPLFATLMAAPASVSIVAISSIPFLHASSSGVSS